MVYVPSTYTGSKKVPLVLVMHGYTASMYAIAEESRWYDVAEQNGFIVVFCAGPGTSRRPDGQHSHRHVAGRSLCRTGW